MVGSQKKLSINYEFIGLSLWSFSSSHILGANMWSISFRKLAITSFCCQYSLTKLIRIPGVSASPNKAWRWTLSSSPPTEPGLRRCSCDASTSLSYPSLFKEHWAFLFLFWARILPTMVRNDRRYKPRIKHALFQADLRLTDPVDLSKDIVATTFPPQVTYQSILSS